MIKNHEIRSTKEELKPKALVKKESTGEVQSTSQVPSDDRL
jgi:hypothetical protein